MRGNAHDPHPNRQPKKPPRAKPVRARNADGFMVEEDGMVEVMLDVTFDKDPIVRVTPDVAKRLVDGEFEGQDPSDIPGIDLDDMLNTPMVLGDATEVYPLPPDSSALNDDLEEDLP